MSLELDDIQSGALRPRLSPYVGIFILLRIDDRRAGRELIRRLIPALTDATNPADPSHQAWVSAALTFEGLKALGVPQDSLDSFCLAEVEAALGETESAIAWLRPLTISSDDPDYAGQLARILSKVGRVAEAREWRDQAAARYDELVARHIEAFADHAAEFWLEVGGDPDRARWLAGRNLQVRQTPRAHELLARATLAGDGARAIHPARDGAGA